jgi:DNA-binding PadR family transcriptional regulator
MDTSSSLEHHLPLTETTFFILLCLTSGPRHGYVIQKEIQMLSSGRVVLSTGTLYGAIKRLVEQGWIERFEGADQDESGRPRKEYRLTERGRRIFDAEYSRMQNLVLITQRRTSGEPI